MKEDIAARIKFENVIDEAFVGAEEPFYQGWTMRWDRKNKVFSVMFQPEYFNRPKRHKDVLVVTEDGAVITSHEAEILHLQKRLAEIMRTGDLK